MKSNAKSFKIVSKFYVIYGDGVPIYVGYTNRTVRQRFTEHRHDKDFSDYDNVKSIELKDQRMSFDFTWDYNETCKNAEKVSGREEYLVNKYHTQDTCYQKAIGGGQTWATEKWFVECNKDNPRFVGMSGVEIKKRLKEEKAIGVWLNGFVSTMQPVEEVWLSNFVSTMQPVEEVWLNNFIGHIQPIEEVWLNNFVNNMQPVEEVWISSFVTRVKPIEEVWLNNFVNDMQPVEEVWLNNFVNNMQPVEKVWIYSFINNMKPVEERWLNDFVNSMKPVEELWLKGFVSTMQPFEEVWIHDFVGSMQPKKAIKIKSLDKAHK